MIGVILTIVLVGVILYLVETYVPMSPPFVTVLRIVVVVAIVLWLAQLFGLVDTPVPRVR
jgi:hypothetical protein